MPSGHEPLRPKDDTVTLTAPAKLNLNLRITGRRDDGYHLLESAVVFTAFGDSLTICSRDAGGDDILAVTGPFSHAMPAASADNICLRAVRAFRQAGGAYGPLDIRLDKQIPAGAGLGGGSSDAATILRHLNRTSPAPVPGQQLADIALELGADVPVCLAGGAQQMSGIGEILAAIDPAPGGHVVLAKPDIMLSTPEVFARLKPADTSRPDGAGTAGDARALTAIGNDLTPAAMRLAPAITTLLGAIDGCQGCLVSQMSGSGAACFGLFPDQGSARRAADNLQAAGYWAVATDF